MFRVMSSRATVKNCSCSNLFYLFICFDNKQIHTNRCQAPNKELKTRYQIIQIALKDDVSYKTWCPEVTNPQDIESD